MTRKTLMETLRNGFIEAVNDIRHKVLEEGVFGRETTKDIEAGAAEIAAPEPYTSFADYRTLQSSALQEPTPRDTSVMEQ